MNAAGPFADLTFADVTDLYCVLADTIGKDDAFTLAVAKEIASRIVALRSGWCAFQPPPPPNAAPPPPPPPPPPQEN